MNSTSTLSQLLSKVRTFDALRYHRNYRFLLASSSFHSICLMMLMIVQGWLAYELTGSVFLVAVYGAVRMTPQLLGPFAGAVVDMLNRKKIIITLRIFQTFFASVLVILSALGLLQFWHLVVIGFLQGLLMTVSFSAFATITMDIVGGEDIVNAISLNMVVMNITSIIGPAVGGALVSFLGPTSCFLVAAILSSFATIFLLPMTVQIRTITTNLGSIFQELAQGFKYFIHNRDMVAVVLITLVANLFIWPARAFFMPVFAKDNLGLDAFGLGILTSGFGLGALLGCLIIASMGKVQWKGLVYLLGTFLFALFFGAFVLLKSFTPALLFVSLAGLASSGFGTMQGVLTLILAPEDMRGRSMGFMIFAIGGMSLGSLALGVAANFIGANLATAISCAILSVSIIAIALWAPNLRRL